MQIQLIPGEDIDKVKWNSCVHYATNGNIFGYEWYLKNTAKEWDALVENDYESVMPLIYREGKRGKKELYLPPLVRSAGIYSINVLSGKRINAFLNAIPEEYGDITLSLNTGTIPPNDIVFHSEQISNCILVMGSDYETISQKYTEEFQELLKKASEHQLVPSGTLKPEHLADFYRQHTKVYRGLEARYHTGLRIMYNTLHRGWGFMSGIQNQEGKLLAASFFIFSHGRMMSLFPIQSPEGAEKGALALLCDLLVRKNAGRKVLIDFNTPGSDWPESILDGLDTRIIHYNQLEKKRQRKWYELF
ncbi:MAG: hypothetical protein AAFV95_25385 [Bacteroidota bacterium]